ncbi:uncharacterized protein (DUF2147 family) [Ancylobacter sp. 3268]|uniref:DUF2147 domain-containing protein n=1 Tax=Ancylobacter sp. 3268 TaxID=2817752 RepID=UPI0028662CC7|nr:DUF2147 domain-containing protein [Ancylobacter sp. 3268]MDR6951187.1 uncharacterized protein (DUF2147 family) [Ancylobacter sp. 3268]
MFKSLRRAILAASFVLGMTALPAAGAFAQASSPNEIVGVWESEDGNLKIEMFDAGGSYAARMLYGARAVEADGKTFKKDTQNPDPALRNRSLEGIVFINDLKWSAGNRRWEGGSFYVAPSGQTLSGQAGLKDGKLELQAYMGLPVLGQTMVLRRVE